MMNARAILIVALLLAGASGAGSRCARAEHFENPETAVQGGREALDRWWGYPWYNGDTDGVKRIELRTAQPWNPNWNWTTGADLFRVLGWIGLALVLAAVAWLLIRSFLERERAQAELGKRKQTTDEESQVDRVTALPFQLKRPQSNLLSEARRNYEEGNYSEAIVYLFSHQLVELDKAHIIRLTRGKTNRQYVREARFVSQVGDVLQQTMRVFEDAFFGNHVIAREQFETCWRRLPEFEQYLRQVAS